MGSIKQDITPAQERYCQERAKGATQRQAYLRAFPGSQKWKPETVDKRACELEAKRKVAGRLKELQKAAAAAAVVTVLVMRLVNRIRRKKRRRSRPGPRHGN